MVKVSIHHDSEFPEICELYAKDLQQWKEGGKLSNLLGNEGQWEENRKLCDSYVFKIHIRLPDEKAWSHEIPQAARKSNSYLVYTRHWLDPNRYQIISIMTPNAHELARTSFLGELERRAELFQNT
ncbi:type II toxin-antitoxin system YafO family toxin [Serratia marcescens]|uniref:type II toxin-antitoxin system YafO family toxin n=1 Tax=Serratia marcescens TaxID=615 RepID=UPI00093105E5|nr:type II toxin-antitoxin system YafO family toxin [Serratia marcescens]